MDHRDADAIERDRRAYYTRRKTLPTGPRLRLSPEQQRDNEAKQRHQARKEWRKANHC